MKIHVRKCVAPSGTSSFVEKFLICTWAMIRESGLEPSEFAKADAAVFVNIARQFSRRSNHTRLSLCVFDAKFARQEPRHSGRQVEDNDVYTELGQHGVTDDENTDAEIGDRRYQPNPNEKIGAVYCRSIFPPVDLRSDKNKQGQQNQPDQRDSKRVHRGRYYAA